MMGSRVRVTQAAPANHLISLTYPPFLVNFRSLRLNDCIEPLVGIGYAVLQDNRRPEPDIRFVMEFRSVSPWFFGIPSWLKFIAPREPQWSWAIDESFENRGLELAKMDLEKLGTSRILNMIYKLPAAIWDSRFRQWLQNPERILRGAHLQSGQTVLEVGCGSGFFTIPAAKIIGESGKLIAMDPVEGFVDSVRKKAQAAGLENIEAVRRDALRSSLDAASIDAVLLFGVIPFPTLPLGRLLPEMHRVLKPKGTMAVWLFPSTAGVPTAIRRSGLFTELGRKNGVYLYRRRQESN